MNAATLRQARLVRRAVRALGVHRVVTAVGLLQLPVLALLSAVLRRLPRDPALVALGAPLDRFADNSAYLFLHLSEHCPHLRPVWITASRQVLAHLRARGLSAELRWSARGVRTCVRAGSFVYSGYRSDVNRLLSPGAVTVCLWHGIKRVGKAGTGAPGAGSHGALDRLVAAAQEPPADYFLSSTPYVTQHIFSPTFGTPPERCWELGYPRNDHLVQGSAPPQALVDPSEQWAELAAADRVVGVFLTWRGDRSDDAIDEDVLLQLAAVCRAHGARLAYKAHYNVHAASVLAENCTLLPSTADLNAHLGLCDVLVTDYSSVASDFLLLRRPVVYFMPDLEQFAARPGFLFAPELLPGTLTRSVADLLHAVDAALRQPVRGWSDRDEQFLRLLWGEPRPASPAIAEAHTDVTVGSSGAFRSRSTPGR